MTTTEALTEREQEALEQMIVQRFFRFFVLRRWLDPGSSGCYLLLRGVQQRDHHQVAPLAPFG